MDDKDIITLTEVAARSKSNTYAINELKEEMKEIKSEQKALYELTSSVKLIAQDMSYMKKSIDEVKQGQCKLTNKMDNRILELDNKIQKVDNKGKFDTIHWFVKFVIPSLLMFGAGAWVISLIK